MVPTRRLARFASAFLWLFPYLASATDGTVRVSSFEPVELQFHAPPAVGTQKSGASAIGVRLTAFGTTLTIELQTNAIANAVGARAETYRGSIVGRDNSWVRITRNGDDVHGLLFDGRELLAIEPAVELDASSMQGNAIFRLADTHIDLDVKACASHPMPSDGLDLYQSLSAESKSALEHLRKAGAHSRLLLSVLIDPAFRERFAGEADAYAALAARINNLDGIFSSQLGLEIQLTNASGELAQYRFETTNPETLLQQVARLRGASAVLHGTGLTHLFTGMDLEGRTIGIAYLDSICGRHYAASLSEARERGAWFDALVAAHEIGHSFGSPHDGESECAATPATFLMAANINGNDKFSQCSLNRIRTRMQTAVCLVPIPRADLAVPSLPSEQRVPVDSEVPWSLTVVNIGHADAVDATLQVHIPPMLVVSAARTENDLCQIGGGVVHCALGTLPAGTSRTLQLTLRAGQLGVHSIVTTVSAVGESNPANNTSTSLLRVEPSIDVALSLSAPTTAAIDQSITASFTVVNKSAAQATNLTVDLVLPAGFAVSGTPQLAGGACETQFQVIRCAIAQLTVGHTLTGSATLVAREPGAQLLSATLTGSFSDPQPADNAMQHTIMVSAPAQATSTAAGTAPESGGGAIGNCVLAALVLMWLRGLRRI